LIQNETTAVGTIFSLGGPDLLLILVMIVLLSTPILTMIGLYSLLSRRPPKLLPPAFEDPHKPHVTVADRLTQLQSMRGEGLISEEEYKLQRTRILNEI
jgi:hypothetical protein